MSNYGLRPRLKGIDLISKSKRINFVLPTDKTETSTQGNQETKESTAFTGKEAREFYESLLGEIEEKPSTSLDHTVFKVPSIPKNKRIKVEAKPIATDKEIFSDLDFYRFLRSASEGNLKEVQKWLNQGMPIDSVDDFGWTALMCASFEGQIEVVKSLLKRKADRDVVNSQKKTALDLAIEKNQREVIKELTRHQINSKRKGHRITARGYCELCEKEYDGLETDHITKTSHLLRMGEKGQLHTGYGIPETNVGYRMLKRTGWNEYRGLGREEEGKRFPIRTILKRDRSGLGVSKGESRVTHFQANDLRAVETAETLRKGRRHNAKQIRTQLEKDREFDRKLRESFKYDFEDLLK